MTKKRSPKRVVSMILPSEYHLMIEMQFAVHVDIKVYSVPVILAIFS
jgi:hypothetical protein